MFHTVRLLDLEPGISSEPGRTPIGRSFASTIPSRKGSSVQGRAVLMSGGRESIVRRRAQLD